MSDNQQADDTSSPPPAISKGKRKSTDSSAQNRVSFAPDVEHAEVDERAPLLGASDGHDDDDESVVPQSRLFRKSRKGVLFGGVRRASNGDGLPTYADERRETRRGWSGTVNAACSLILLVFIIFVTLLCIRPGDLPRRSHPPINSPEPSAAPRNPAYLIEAKNGAVSSEAKDCSNIGVEVLKEGGSAVDAAIAATLCIGVMNMFSSGIGGGGFMTVRTGKSPSDVYTIDFRETAPALSNATMFEKDPVSSIWGGLSVGVPGELRGMAEAHRRWGKLPWKRLFEPSVTLARGWTVTAELEKRLEVFAQFALEDPDWQPVFTRDGKLLKEGDFISRSNYSRTLALIGEEGAEAFYKGPIADSLINKIKATGGIMTHKDLKGYRPVVQKALQGSYRGHKIFTSHAPTSGPVVLHILNLLEPYNFTGEGRTPLNVHRSVEAMKFGFAARTKICDPAFSNDTQRIDEISTKHFAKMIGHNITDDTTHTAEYYHPVYDVPDDHGTTHTSVVDSTGMAVALTSTVNLVFGSRVMDPETGVILNDEMDDFSKPGQPNFFGLYPSPYNYPAPGKRPLSSTAPTIIEKPDGSFYAALGGSGGSRIFGSIVQVILNLDWGFDLGKAVEFPRFHDQLFPAFASIESTFPEAEIKGLRDRGHNTTVFDINTSLSVVQAVLLAPNGTIYAASDSRKNGVAAGY